MADEDFIIEQCGNCKFYSFEYSNGECHRYPPQVIWVDGTPSAGSESVSPTVTSKEWCGEWKLSDDVCQPMG